MTKKTVLFVITLVFIYSGFLSKGVKVANDFPLASQDNLLAGFNIAQTWSSRTAEGMGEYVVATLWAWPVDFLYGLGARLGFNFSILQRILGILPILVLGGHGIRKFLKHVGVRGWGLFLGALFYLVNTYILLVIDGGQFAIGLAYAWMPIAYLALNNAVKGGLRQRLLAGLGVSILGFFDIRFIYILFILFGLKFIFDTLYLDNKNESLLLRSSRLFRKYLSVGATVVLIFVGFNVYWILPAIYSQALALPATYQRASQASFLSFANLGHALTFLQPHWFENVFGKIAEPRVEFFIIPILVFLAPVLKKKSKVVGFWLLVALLGVFLVKGANTPLPGVYPWLFTNVPGFSLFRDPTKFFFLVALSYSVLIGITVNELTKKFNWKIVLGKWNIAVIPLILAAYFIFLVRPVWLGQMTGTFAAPIYQDEYFALAEKLKSDKNFGRVLWISSRAPLGYSSPSNPSVEASRLVQKRPFAIGNVGIYERFNFLRESPFMGELFDIAAIKYIAYPFPDERREKLKQDNIDYYYAFLDQLSNLSWIDSRISDSPVAALKTKKSQDHFFLAKNTFLVVGSDRIYWDLTEIDGFDLSNNALIFAEEQPGLGNGISDYSRVILYEKDPIDFAATFIDKSNYVFPANDLGFDPDETGWPASNALRSNAGWWKRETADFISWRNFLQQKYGIDNLDFDYGGGWSVAEGNRILQITNDKFQNGNMLLARVMKSGRGGIVEFYQGDEKIGEINTKISDPTTVEVELTGYEEIPDQSFKYKNADTRWYEVGILADSSESIEVRTRGEINVVNAIAAIPQKQWEQINELINRYEIINWDELTNLQKTSLFAGERDKIELNYQRISPTHYKIRIKGINKPVTLAFSETYDRLWELKGQEPYPLYSLINGFTLLEDGEYDLYFSAQQYVIPGLYLSGLTLIVVFVLLVRPGKKS